jgi:hypothetical protein
VLVGLAVLAAAWAQAADSFPIGVYPVPRVDAALELDGKLDDASWQAAPLVSGFTLFETDTLCEVQTAFRVLYDDEYLYFGIHCDEPKMAQLLPTRVPLDEHGIFRTETIELRTSGRLSWLCRGGSSAARSRPAGCWGSTSIEIGT